MPEPITTLNEEILKTDLCELTRKTVEDALNGPLDEDADGLVGAERHERAAEKKAYRAGNRERVLIASSGEVTIHMPELKSMRLVTAIIGYYRRCEASVEEAIIEMELSSVSTRPLGGVSELL